MLPGTKDTHWGKKYNKKPRKEETGRKYLENKDFEKLPQILETLEVCMNV